MIVGKEALTVGLTLDLGRVWWLSSGSWTVALPFHHVFCQFTGLVSLEIKCGSTGVCLPVLLYSPKKVNQYLRSEVSLYLNLRCHGRWTDSLGSLFIFCHLSIKITQVGTYFKSSMRKRWSKLWTD